MRYSASKLILVFGMVLIWAALLTAQKPKKNEDEATRTLQGLVTDAAEKPVQDAVVQLKDLRTLQIRSYLTKEDGTYHFAGLKTDTDYQVKAAMGDLASGTKTLSVFDSRKIATINLKLDKKESRD
ncbi:MAG: carboxypeptidase regulatory-like domain-containing protein [Bryobacterales bacterium]|nr:carboxypeptidase regulatory-like domain-containing protein [Bryobacterales bacterium]MBV9400434.1 carboxypeptidase regulatory-like domain-containing protein [Bryobacterales bacterium]